MNNATAPEVPHATVPEPLIEIDFSQTLEAMIAAGRYDWVNSDITAKNFPVEGEGKKTFRTKLFHFGRNISSEDAVAAMEKENFAPATHVHGLAFGATFPDEQRTYPIVCLGSSARVHFSRSVVCLHGGDAYRGLDLYVWDGDWDDYWHFLAVQEVSDA